MSYHEGTQMSRFYVFCVGVLEDRTREWERLDAPTSRQIFMITPAKVYTILYNM